MRNAFDTILHTIGINEKSQQELGFAWLLLAMCRDLEMEAGEGDAIDAGTRILSRLRAYEGSGGYVALRSLIRMHNRPITHDPVRDWEAAKSELGSAKKRLIKAVEAVRVHEKEVAATKRKAAVKRREEAAQAIEDAERQLKEAEEQVKADKEKAETERLKPVTDARNTLLNARLALKD
jgi:hypothetical protein